MARVADVLGVEFYPITFSGACRALDWMLSLSDGHCRVVITGNPIMVMAARKDPAFGHILRNADLLVPDGVGIVWAARKSGTELPERVTGVDLTRYLLSRRDPAPGIFLLGGKPGVAVRAKNRLLKDMPWVRVVGLHHGYFGQDEESAVVTKIRTSQAEVVLAGMGQPRQEMFLWRNRDSLGAKLGMGVGGTLDILAGDKTLSPEFLRRAGLEWLHRLLREPGRIKADLALAHFAALVLAGSLFSKGRESEGDREDDDQGYLDARRR